MTDPLYYLGFCRICGTGPLGLRVCGKCDEVVVLCDECDAVWTDAKLEEKPIFSQDPDLPCPACSESLFQEASHWASREEIEAVGWLATALGEGSLTLAQGGRLEEEQRDA